MCAYRHDLARYAAETYRNETLAVSHRIFSTFYQPAYSYILVVVKFKNIVARLLTSLSIVVHSCRKIRSILRGSQCESVHMLAKD